MYFSSFAEADGFLAMALKKAEKILPIAIAAAAMPIESKPTPIYFKEINSILVLNLKVNKILTQADYYLTIGKTNLGRIISS